MKNKGFLLGILAIGLIFGTTVVGCITMTPVSETGQIRVVNNSGGRFWIAGPQFRNYNMQYTMNSQPLDTGREFIYFTHEDGAYYIYYLPVSILDVDGPRDRNFLNWSSKSITISKGETVRVEIP